MRNHLRSSARICLIAAFCVLLFLLLCPFSFRVSRLAIILCVLITWPLAVAFSWRIKWIRYPFLAVSIYLIGLLILPLGTIKPDSMRRAYVSNLLGYEGTRYIWGGENMLGIDCSGLVRKGLINADLKLGFLGANPRLFRLGLGLWWFDSSARALGEEYRNLTRMLFPVPSINELDHSLILPGDIAVTRDKIHVMAYIGDQTWIEADPEIGKVVTVKTPSEDNQWFRLPVVLLRWRQLE